MRRKTKEPPWRGRLLTPIAFGGGKSLTFANSLSARCAWCSVEKRGRRHHFGAVADGRAVARQGIRKPANARSHEELLAVKSPHEALENNVQLKASMVLALACVIAGCAQTVIPEPALPPVGPIEKAQNAIPEPAPRPDDKSAIALDCSGLLQGWNNCMLTASNTCGSRGYTILDRSDQRPPLLEDSVFTRSMHIRCNG